MNASLIAFVFEVGMAEGRRRERAQQARRVRAHRALARQHAEDLGRSLRLVRKTADERWPA